MKVLIVGAGPAGLVMANELARFGVQCRLIDKQRERSKRSRAIAILPRTIEVFDLMRVAEDFLAAGRRIHAINIISNGERIVRIGLNRLDSPYPFALALPQDETERLLENHLLRRGMAVERSKELMALEQSEDGVDARIRIDGSRVETLHCDYLIGCDGVHSTVRHLLGMPFRGGSYKETVLLADIRASGNHDRDEAQIFLNPNGLVLFFPMPEDRYRLVAPDPPPQWGVEPTLDQCQSLIDARGPGHLRLTDLRWTSTFRISHRIVDQFKNGRIFLAGDAAHIHSPMGAQGMNAGVQDAFNLGWKFGFVAAGAARDELLDSYESERKPIDSSIIRWTDLGTRLLLVKGAVAHRIQREILTAITSFESTRRRFMDVAAQIVANYRGGRFVEEHVLAIGPHAGDRAPDATIRSEKNGAVLRLFDLFAHPRYTLLLFWPGTAGWNLPDRQDLMATYRIVDVESAAGDFKDVAGLAALHYGTQPAAYLIRPDGYVAFRCALADAARLLPGYLQKIVFADSRLHRRVA